MTLAAAVRLLDPPADAVPSCHASPAFELEREQPSGARRPRRLTTDLVSFQSAMPVGRADTPASDGLLAATLQAFGDHGYRSEVDAAVSAARPGLIAQLLNWESQLRVRLHFRFDPSRPCWLRSIAGPASRPRTAAYPGEAVVRSPRRRARSESFPLQERRARPPAPPLRRECLLGVCKHPVPEFGEQQASGPHWARALHSSHLGRAVRVLEDRLPVASGASGTRVITVLPWLCPSP